MTMRGMIIPGLCISAVVSFALAMYQFPGEGNTQCYEAARNWARDRPESREEIRVRLADDGILSRSECQNLNAVYERLNTDRDRAAMQTELQELLK